MQLKEENKIDERKKRGDMEEELRRKWKTLEVRGAWVRVGSLCFHRCGAVRSREREREREGGEVYRGKWKWEMRKKEQGRRT